MKEQDKKMSELSASPASSSVSDKSLNLPYLPTTMSAMQIAQPMVIESVSSKDIPTAEIYLISVKGIGDKLTASIVSNEIGIAVVTAGDILANGSKVKKVNQNSIVIENINGDVDTIGITLNK
jgi:hypothetical protein